MNFFQNFFRSPTHFRPVVGYRRNGRLFHLNDEEYREQIIKHISLLKSLGFQKGTKVALMAETSIEWHLFDVAITLCGGILIPIYTTFSSRDLKVVLDASKPEIIILQGCHLLNTHKEILDANIKIITLTEDAKVSCKKSNYDYQTLCDEIIEANEKIDLSKLASERNNDEYCSFLVTSGTTGDPKIAAFTFGALNSVLENVQYSMRGRLKSGSRSITTLPLAHVLGRCDSLLHFVLPTQTVFGESIDTFITDLQLIKPSFMVTVPRILTKIRKRTLKAIQKEGALTEAFIQLALNTTSSFFEKVESGAEPSRLETKAFQYFQKTVLKSIRDKISPDLQFLVTGGAPLPYEDFHFFRNIGIPILEGYGLTETLGPICMNPLEDPQSGNVGLAYKDVEIHIDTDGEILIRCPYLLKEYLGKPKDESFTEDGFLRTGDIGDVTTLGRLKITDRKKDIIVNSYGKNIYPLKIESLFSTSTLIDNVLVTGEGKPYLTALIFTSRDHFGDLIDNGILDPSCGPEQLITVPEVQEMIKAEVERLNEELANHEQVKKYSLIPLKIDASDSFITPSLKLKREHIYNKFHQEIENLYR